MKSIECPICRQRLRLPDGDLPQKARCPSCKSSFNMAFVEESAPIPPPLPPKPIEMTPSAQVHCAIPGGTPSDTLRPHSKESVQVVKSVMMLVTVCWPITMASLGMWIYKNANWGDPHIGGVTILETAGGPRAVNTANHQSTIIIAVLVFGLVVPTAIYVVIMVILAVAYFTLK